MRYQFRILNAILYFGLITATFCQQARAVDFYEQTVLNDNPLLYWRLGESSTASPAANLGSQGVAQNGTYGSTTSLGISGALFNSTNTAAGFTSGTTTSFARKTSYAFPTGSFSSEIWVKTPTSGATQSIISYNSASANGENDFLLVFQNNNTVQLIMSNGTAQATSLNIADNNWHHLVTTWDISTGQLNIYNNGASVFSSIYQTGIGRTSLGSLMLGQEQDGNAGTYSLDPAQALNGNLDEFALYSGVLTPEQILLHYQVGVGIVLPPPPAPEPSSFCLLGLGVIAIGRVRRRCREQIIQRTES